jgi:hypothetical protein
MKLAGWVDGWVDGWMDGRESRVKYCLQQSKICLQILGNGKELANLLF